MTSDDEFDALIESAYAEPLTITGSVGDDDMTQVVPTPDRDGVDLGVAGSLRQARTQLRIQQRADLGPPYRDRITVVAAVALLACAVTLGLVVGGLRLPGPGFLTGLLAVVLIVGIIGSAWVLIVRYGPTPPDGTSPPRSPPNSEPAVNSPQPWPGRRGCCSTIDGSHTASTGCRSSLSALPGSR